jgi:hypothetical protein
MKKLLFVFLMLPALCFAEPQYIAAAPMGNSGADCRVLVSDYRPGSYVEYLGGCGWQGLKGTAAYVQAWNHSNHTRVVRGVFSSGKPIATTKVMYINGVSKKIVTYNENDYQRLNVKVYNLDDVLTDAVKAGVNINDDTMSYIRLANYIDIFE